MIDRDMCATSVSSRRDPFRAAVPSTAREFWSRWGILEGMKFGRVRANLVLAGVLAVSVAALSPAWAGTIKGTVQYTGPDVQPKRVPMTIDEYVCGKDKEAEDLLLTPTRAIRNAVVWLQTPPPGSVWEGSLPSPKMDQKQCAFVPRIVIVPVGGTVQFLNSDRLLHNLKSAGKENPTFNRAQSHGRTIPIVFGKPEIVRVDCDLHSWMRAWVVVADHPFYAVSNDRGEFTLDQVPPGDYTLRIWQESLGSATKSITVGTAGTTTVTVEMAGK